MDQQAVRRCDVFQLKPRAGFQRGGACPVFVQLQKAPAGKGAETLDARPQRFEGLTGLDLAQEW
jgi:hypothetical protein